MFIKSCDDASNLTPSTSDGNISLPLLRNGGIQSGEYDAIGYPFVCDGRFCLLGSPGRGFCIPRRRCLPSTSPAHYLAILVRMPVISLANMDVFVLAGGCEPISRCGDISVQSSKLVEQIHDPAHRHTVPHSGLCHTRLASAPTVAMPADNCTCMQY